MIPPASTHHDASDVEWAISDAPVPYPEALAAQEARVAAIRAGAAPELVWLLEHPPTYTAGTSARAEDLVDPRFPTFSAGRGGQWTYHGPGQVTGYVMLDLNRRGKDIRRYVQQLEEWLILSLWRFNVRGERREGRVGIWVADPATGGEAKIAALACG
jgi:lipoyl(octanoyl) transferase